MGTAKLPSGSLRRQRRGRRPYDTASDILNQRLSQFLVVLLMLIGVLILRLIFLQGVEGEKLKDMAVERQQLHVRGIIPRREIVDRRSVSRQEAEWLAVDRPVYTLWVHPKMLQAKNLTPGEIATALSPILQKEVSLLQQQLSQAGTIRLDTYLSEDKARQIQALGIDALDLERTRQRIYPQKEMAAAVTGYVQNDTYQGMAGIERTQQSLLERISQPLVLSANGYGLPLPAEVPKGFLQSSETVLQTTLDMRLQRTAQKALQTQMEQYQADRGTAIVMDPYTGEILALAISPTYDPNHYFDGYDPRLFRNWAVADLYEPGSTFKPINVAIALDAGVIQPNSRFYDEGRIQVGGWPIQNFDYQERGSHGSLSVGEILNYSSNVGMVHIVNRLNPRQYFDGLQKVGLGQSNGTDLPFAATSRVKDKNQFVQVVVERATTAFGQGFSLTPLDLITFHAAIANGGQRIIPHVVRGLVEKSTDSLVWKPAQPDSERIFTAATTQLVRAMMLDVVENGTGKAARIPGYAIAGKTGTAQKADRGVYLPGIRITSFVGYFPALSPRYVLLAVVDNPKGDDAFGSTVAAPIVRGIIQEIIALEALDTPS